MNNLVLEESRLEGVYWDNIDKKPGIEKTKAMITHFYENYRKGYFYSFLKKNENDNLAEVEAHKIVSYHYEGTTKETCRFFTSYYVGFYNTTIEGEQISLTIIPRFGEKVSNYLYANALGVYLTDSTTSISQDKFHNQWFLALLWVGALEGAITQAHIPKTYIRESKNLTYFKGRLDVGKQIIHNLTTPHKMYCQYPKLTYDTPINRTLCKVYKILKKTDSPLFSPSIQGHFSMLSDFGVRDEISMREIENITYTPLNRAYQKVIELSKIIISQKGQSNTTLQTSSMGQGFFLDMSEVWESYLYNKILSKLEGFEVRNCNLDGGDKIFRDEDVLGEMRPDFKLMRGNELVAIIDAKYKNVSKIKEISREDRYQMMSYMYRYDCHLGIFITPNAENGECGYEEAIIDNEKKGKILVFSFPLQWLDKENIEDFHSKILELEEEMRGSIVGYFNRYWDC